MWIISMIMLPAIYLYYVCQIGSIEAGKLKKVVVFILMSICTIVSAIFVKEYLGAVLGTIIIILFDLFYDEESFHKQYKWILTFGVAVCSLFLLHKLFKNFTEVVVIIAIFLIMYILLSSYRKLISSKTNVIVISIYLSYIFLAYSLNNSRYSYVILFLVVSTFGAFESILLGYNKIFKRKTSEFQEDLLINQYEEIKTVYLNMRGFRHDYHNHIQVIKAHLYMDRLDLVDEYLLELEGELERIDSRVRSGNLMLDAILNSKIAIAEKYSIKVKCKAEVNKDLPVSDIDLCVILGNLLDNAIESCQKLNENKFIRIYVAIIKKQLYISIQNSAKEELDFNDRNYITNKRGNHGLGMKRVNILVNKYNGFLNLQNEPGIFASEVTLPI
mgnify:CR=1 FL=1